MIYILFRIYFTKGCIRTIVGIFIICLDLLLFTCGFQENLGEFEGQTNVGDPEFKGAVQFNAGDGTYQITGGGKNIWGNADEFYYVWRRVEGDLTLTAVIEWAGEGKNAHRKAGWMVRGGLEEDAPYVDAVVHGDGLISLQFRQTVDGLTREVKAPVRAPATICLERDGHLFTLSVAINGEQFQPVATITVELNGNVYAGLVACAHDSTTRETVVFSDVNFKTSGVIAQEERVLESTMEIINVETGERRIVRRAKEHFEAPNWSRDGRTLIYNSKGNLYTLPRTGGQPQLLNTGFANRCNNDHGISPDGKQLAISHATEGQSLIYILSSNGGEPRLITEFGPSYWHGWSPDGKTLVYCASRKGDYDIYTIPVQGGKEKRLTNTEGLDDGPDYSPDGKFIFFNSVRTGQMKIWRMKADGSEQVQITYDDNYNDWFSHPSPNGKWLVFLSYEKSVQGHPPNKNVVLRIMPMSGGEPRVLAYLFGGQGTINVPSWSPDSKWVSFVSYRFVSSYK